MKGYDFLTWTSFPSSGKITHYDPTGEAEWWGVWRNIPITPGETLRFEINVKQKDVTSRVRPSHLGFWWSGEYGGDIRFPLGTFDWRTFTLEKVVPDGKTLLTFTIAGGSGPSKDTPGITWFDDLRIFMDDKLIYDNYFSATPRPLGIVPVFNVTERVVKVYQRVRPGIIKPK